MFGTYCRLGVHVGASPLAVARALWSRLKRPLPPRARRRKLLRAMLREHKDARALYHAVML